MDYQTLLNKKEAYEQKIPKLSRTTLDSYTKSFEIEYTHHSTAIEGNTLSLIETKVVIEDQLSIGGKHLREIYEVVNHHKAFSYVKQCISSNRPLEEIIVKDIHAILMESILLGGIYRSVDVRITGAKHRPPSPHAMYLQIKNFYDELPKKTELNAVELAAWTHAEFVKIHPFEDGNGRTSRLLMNFQLMNQGFLPIIIEKERRLEYFDALECYATEGDVEPFTNMVAQLEEDQLDMYLGLT